MTIQAPEVVAYGEGLEAGLEYAHLRGCAFSKADTLNQVGLRLTSTPAAKVLSIGHAKSADIAALAGKAHNANMSLGFINGWCGEAESISHAQALARWHSRRQRGISAWLDESTLAGMNGEFDDLTIYDSDSDFSAYTRSVHRVAALKTHGNGIDAPAGRSILCGLIDVQPGATLYRYFPCGFGGPCIRGTKDNEAGAAVRLSTRSLPGDVVIWGTCNGLLLSDSQFDARGGLMRGLLDARDVRQVIIPCKLITIDESALLAAALYVNAGHTLGHALRILNSAYLSHSKSASGPAWILMGDPNAHFHEDLGNPTWDIRNCRSGVCRTGSDRSDRMIIIDGFGKADEKRRTWGFTGPGKPSCGMGARRRLSHGSKVKYR